MRSGLSLVRKLKLFNCMPKQTSFCPALRAWGQAPLAELLHDIIIIIQYIGHIYCAIVMSKTGKGIYCTDIHACMHGALDEYLGLDYILWFTY